MLSQCTFSKFCISIHLTNLHTRSGFRLVTWTGFLIWIQEKSRSRKIQNDQKMPRSGLWIQEKSRLDSDPDRSLLIHSQSFTKFCSIQDEISNEHLHFQILFLRKSKLIWMWSDCIRANQL